MNEEHLLLLANHPTMQLCIPEYFARGQCARYIMMLEQHSQEPLSMKEAIDSYRCNWNRPPFPLELLLT